jgi:hypothetical protein
MLSSLSYGTVASAKLKCELNLNSVSEIGTWRLADESGKRLTEINFGSASECAPWAKATNGDYFCSAVMRGPSQGFRAVIASQSQAKVVAVLPMHTGDPKKDCVSFLSSRHIVDDKICVRSAYDWEIIDLKTGEMLSESSPSAEGCEDLLVDSKKMKSAGRITNFKEYHGRKITAKITWMPQMKRGSAAPRPADPDGVEVYLDDPSDCSVGLSGVWCPNPKIKFGGNTWIQPEGVNTQFLLLRSFNVWAPLANAYAELVNIPGGIETQDGITHHSGFVLHQP